MFLISDQEGILILNTSIRVPHKAWLVYQAAETYIEAQELIDLEPSITAARLIPTSRCIHAVSVHPLDSKLYRISSRWVADQMRKELPPFMIGYPK